MREQRLCAPNPDLVWPMEAMSEIVRQQEAARAVLTIDAIAGLYTGPQSMNDIFRELREAGEFGND